MSKTPPQPFFTARFALQVTNDLKNLEGVSFSAIDGAAFGGGAELATSTDFRVLGNEAGVHSRIKFMQAMMGVTTGWGGGTRLVELVGKEVALKLLLTSQEISTTTPPNALINFIAPEGMSALTHTESLIENIQTTVDPNVVSAIKKMTRGKGNEGDIFQSVWGKEPHQKAFERALNNRR